MHRSTITLDEDAYSFLAKAGGRNRSAFINDLLKREQRRILADKILQANREEAEESYRKELSEWDATLEDGLER